MARNHARVQVGIWQDSDFLDLRPSPQRLYLFLLSQPNLSHLGVLPLTLRRWAHAASAYSHDDLADDLAALQEAGFVVVDEAAEELLIRTLLRNDGVYKQPNVMRSAIASVPAVHGLAIRTALLDELDRIDVSDLSDEVKPKATRSPRAEAKALVTELREAIGDPKPKGSAKGSAKGYGNPHTYARAQPLVLSPSPSPSPTPTTNLSPSTFAAWWQAYPRKVGKQDAAKAYARVVRTIDPDHLLAAAVHYRDDPNREEAYTAHPSTWLNRGSWDDPPIPTRLRPATNRDRTEQVLESSMARAIAAEHGQQQRALPGGTQ